MYSQDTKRKSQGQTQTHNYRYNKLLKIYNHKTIIALWKLNNNKDWLIPMQDSNKLKEAARNYIDNKSSYDAERKERLKIMVAKILQEGEK